MSRSASRFIATALAAALAIACSDDAPDSSPSPTSATALQAVTFGSATPAHPGGTVTMGFSGTMMAGMERYVDLHQGDISGVHVPITCAMSASRDAITCAPNAPLTPGGQHTLHMGAGMLDDHGMPVDMHDGMGMGGTWMTNGMMGGHHGEMMGDGWTDAAGHGGMVFTFTAS
jgi:hypothetical protein